MNSALLRELASSVSWQARPEIGQAMLWAADEIDRLSLALVRCDEDLDRVAELVGQRILELDGEAPGDA